MCGCHPDLKVVRVRARSPRLDARNIAIAAELAGEYGTAEAVAVAVEHERRTFIDLSGIVPLRSYDHVRVAVTVDIASAGESVREQDVLLVRLQGRTCR